ncbi:copia protein [Tanacetum coccineum]
MDYIKLLELGMKPCQHICWTTGFKEGKLRRPHSSKGTKMSSMGELTFFLGLQVQQKKDGIFISQDKYVAEILKKFGFKEVKTASTPMELLMLGTVVDYQIVHVDRIQTWYLILSLFEVPGLAKIHILVLVFEEVSTGSLSSSEADSYGGVIWLAISLPCILVGCKRYGCNEAFDVLHGVSLTPFGIVSESQRFMNRDRHCAYRPIESIGGRSLEPAAIMLLCI